MRKKLQESLTMFLYVQKDEGNCNLAPHPEEVYARDLGHGLQRISPALHDDCVSIEIWRSKVAENSKNPAGHHPSRRGG